MKKIVKFGGSSLANAQQFEKVYVSAGRIGAQLTLAPEDLRKAADATFADVIHA